MSTDRRGFLAAAGVAAFAALAAAVTTKWVPAATAAAPILRPGARGAGAAVCARCGAPGHTDLDAGCPGDAGSRAARQAAARSRARGAGGADA